MASNRTRGTRLLWTGARTLGRSVLGSVAALRGGDARDALWQSIGEDWFRTLSEMKGAAMKFGQTLSQYADVLPGPLAEQLSKLQKDAEAAPYEAVKATLDAVWGPAQWARFRHIEAQALAAASIGQVHAAQLADGREVVIKVRHDGVADAIDSDLAMLGRMLKLSRVMPVDAQAIDEVLAEVGARLREETDYTVELANLQALRARNDDPGIRLPQPVEDLCSDRCLVLERLPAATFEAARQWPQAERDRLGERLFRWNFDQVFRHGRLHADPHPGNFGFARDGTVTVYDFGCVKRIEPPLAALMRDYLRAAERRDWAAIHEDMLKLGALRLGARKPPPSLAEMAPLYAQVHEAIYGALYAGPRYDFADPAVLERCREVARRSIARLPDFRPVRDLAFVMRTLSGLYWLLRGLGARIDVRAEVERHLA